MSIPCNSAHETIDLVPKNSMHKHKEFREWMPKTGMQENSSDSYIDYLEAVEEKLGYSINTLFDNLMREAIDKKIFDNEFSDYSKKTKENFSYGLRKYWDYYQASIGLPVRTKVSKMN